MGRPYFFLLALILSVTGYASSEVTLRFSNVLTDNMVLQRDQDLTIWGWAKAHSEVEVLLTQSRQDVLDMVGEGALERKPGRTIKVNEHPKLGKVKIAYEELDRADFLVTRRKAKTDKDGKWILNLGVHRTSFTPTYLAAKSGDEGVAIKNLLIGEVWIASGQSNMRWRGRANLWESQGLLPNAVRYASHQAGSSKPQEKIPNPINWAPAQDGVASGFSSVPYFFGKFLHEQLKVPVGVINIAQGGSFSSEWCSREVLDSMDSELIARDLKNYDKRFDAPEFKGDRGPATMFNARFFPIRHMSAAGVIYLQGENEALSGSLIQYQKTFPGVIESYRKAMGKNDLPFGIISLQGMGDSDGYGIAPYSIARSIHLETHKVTSNTGYIVAHDIGGGIHPNYKRPLSERAVYWALRDVYGVVQKAKKVRIKSTTFQGSHALVSFEEVELVNGKWTNAKEIWPRTNNQSGIAGFMIAGEDGNWYPGKVGGVGVLDGPSTLALSNPMVKKPVALRYGWEGWSKANLGPFHDPIPPCRSDNWDLLAKDEVPKQDASGVDQGVVRYMEGHRKKEIKLARHLNEGVMSSPKNLALIHAHPKGMMLGMLEAVERLLSHFKPGQFKTMTPEWAEKAFHTIPPRYWRRDRMTPARLAKWSWLMERSFRFDSFVDDMEQALEDPMVKTKLKNFKTSLQELVKAMEELPEPEAMTRPEMLDKFLPLAEKEKERLLEKGVDLRRLEREMHSRPF